ncbi:MAG: hypothetical protein IPM55_18010 [Acidobacteria bacterium]|nr:hypothetical protein [Acidobacteriota bacterium]
MRVNDSIEIDVVLEIGDVSDLVTVSSRPSVGHNVGSIGRVIDSRRVAELPIPHGDPFKLIGLAANVTFSRSAA